MINNTVVLCPKCNSSNLSRSGKRWIGGAKKQQYLCGNCGHRTVNPSGSGEMVRVKGSLEAVPDPLV